MSIYEACPVLENDKFIIRLFQNEDCEDLLRVYSDKNALPFFNSDNCYGDNFYYATREKMARRWIFGRDHMKMVCLSDYPLLIERYQP